MRRLLVVGAVLAVAAVGSSSAGAARATSPTERVVRGWSAALNANRNADAAGLFATRARVIQGAADVLLTRKLALAFNQSLPCGGKIVALKITGERAVATFVLTHRPKHRCDAPGQQAAALFVVHGGKIVLWKQIPVPTQQKPTA